MKNLPWTVLNSWKRCGCQVSARRSRSTCSNESGLDGSARDSFEIEDYFEKDRQTSLNFEPEVINIHDPVLRRKMELIRTEMYLLNERGHKVPRRLSSKQWLDLLGQNSEERRALYLQKIWHTEQKKLFNLKVQIERRKLYLEEKDRNQEQGPFVEKNNKKSVQYGLNFNTLFRGIYQQKMNLFYHYRLLKAMIFGPDIVVDCGYDGSMDTHELHRCAKDINRMWMDNKLHSNPFNVRFCNLREDGPLFPRIKDSFPGFNEPDLPFNYTSHSYLDIYDKEKLIYLTPYSRTILSAYDPDRVYILGALSNNSRKGPLSLAKARKEGLQTAKFPIACHADWNVGPKSLKTSVALAIMNDLKEQRDWRTIFKHHLPPVGTPPEMSEQGRNEISGKIYNMILPKS